MSSDPSLTDPRDVMFETVLACDVLNQRVLASAGQFGPKVSGLKRTAKAVEEFSTTNPFTTLRELRDVHWVGDSTIDYLRGTLFPPTSRPPATASLQPSSSTAPSASSSGHAAASPTSRQVTVRVASDEKAGPGGVSLVSALLRLDVAVLVQHLEAGDIAIDLHGRPAIIIERKRTLDLLQSWSNGRFATQIGRMTSTSARAVVIVENDDQRFHPPQTMYRAIGRIAARHDLSIFLVTSINDTAQVVKGMVLELMST